MSESAASSQHKVEEVLRALEKPYGKVHVCPEQPLLDHAIYLILREKWDYRKALKALHHLQKEFVDWNEVRVSTRGELRDSLAALGDKDLEVKVEKIRTLLEFVWKERNSVGLEFLTERDFEAQQRYLLSSGVLTPAQVQVLLQSLAGQDNLLVPTQAVRVLQRVGVLPRVYSETGARKQVEKLIQTEDSYAFGALLVQHGEEICLVKTPRCSECCLFELCGFRRKPGALNA